MIWRFLACLILALGLGAEPSFAGEKQARAKQAVQALVIDAHSALSGNRNDAALRRAVSNAFAFEIWERYLIKDHAARFTPSQRSEVRALLPGFLSHLYHQQFGKGLDRAPVLAGTRKVRRDIMVSSSFPRANGGNLPVEWRVREVSKQAKVIDVMVGGTSFLLLKKEEFGAIIGRSGADGLIIYMRENAL